MHAIVALEHDPEKWKPVFRKDHAPSETGDPPGGDETGRVGELSALASGEKRADGDLKIRHHTLVAAAPAQVQRASAIL